MDRVDKAMERIGLEIRIVAFAGQLLLDILSAIEGRG